MATNQMFMHRHDEKQNKTWSLFKTAAQSACSKQLNNRYNKIPKLIEFQNMVIWYPYGKLTFEIFLKLFFSFYWNQLDYTVSSDSFFHERQSSNLKSFLSFPFWYNHSSLLTTIIAWVSDLNFIGILKKGGTGALISLFKPS